MQKLSRLLYFIGLAVMLLALWLPDVKLFAQNTGERPVYILEINDDIKAGTVLEVERAVRRASEANASHLVIKLDTAGGLLDSTKRITDTMLAANNVDVTVYVHRAGGWAYSAGTIILLAADQAFVHPHASIGASQPFAPGGGNEIQEEKAKLATASWVRSLAERHNREADIAERFVTENLTLTGEAALGVGVIDGTPTDINAVLELLGAGGAQMVTLEPTLIGRIINTLSHPYMVSLFLALGGLALLLAIRTGEFQISTAIGIALLLVGLWGIGVIEYSFIGAGLLFIGIILIMIEVFDQPGFGIFGVGGIAALFLGILTLSQEPFYAPGILDTASLIAFSTLAAALIAFVLISRAVAKTIKRGPFTGPEAFVGKEALVIETLKPNGRVLVNGESWKAFLITGKRAAKNTKTLIGSVKGNTLYVSIKSNRARKK